MKSIIATIILAATSALAAPTERKRSTTLQITDFFANAASPGDSAFMHFILTDANYPNDTPTECNLIWYDPTFEVST